jgi:hypothetical protein
MNRRLLLGGVLLAATVACTDSVTNPSPMPFTGSARLFDDPPPPPMDSSMATYDGASTTYIAVTYFYNKHGNNVWLSFNKTQAAGVTISPNARITVSEGRAAARGSIVLTSSDGTWSANLAEAITPRALEGFAACKYTCASLTMTGQFTDVRGGTEARTLSFQFKSTSTESDKH